LVAQVGNFDAVALRRFEERLALVREDLAPVEGDGNFDHRNARVHALTPGAASSCGKYLSTHSIGLGAACPRPQMEASRMACESSRSSGASQASRSMRPRAFSVPTRQGVHCPQDSLSKKRMRLRAASTA